MELPKIICREKKLPQQQRGILLEISGLKSQFQGLKCGHSIYDQSMPHLQQTAIFDPVYRQPPPANPFLRTLVAEQSF